MKIEDIHRKLVKKFYYKASNAVNDINDIKESVTSIIAYKDIIDKVITDYNFKGRNFKVEYLPVILAMMVEEVLDKQENRKKELDKVKKVFKKIEANKLAEACLAADIKHF